MRGNLASNNGTGQAITGRSCAAAARVEALFDEAWWLKGSL
jgi:hypothetical protein